MKYGALILVAGRAACGSPGRRAAETRFIRPREFTHFRVLYRQN